MDTSDTEQRDTSALELVSVFPPLMRVHWRDDGGYALRETSVDEAAVLLGPDPTRCRTYLDCGVWSGDGVDAPMFRTFAVLCGGTVVLCEFRSGAPLDDVPGPPSEAIPIQRTLRALAGPQKLDVQIIRWLRVPGRDVGPSEGPYDATVYVFLPDMHLPIVPHMPDLPADLVPDPTQIQCFCHGPVMQRLLGGAPGESPYRAFGATLSRDPNEWFYLMAERFKPVAEDLNKFAQRLVRHLRAARVHLVQMGGLFEVWAGFKVMFHSTGRAGLVSPQIVRGAHFGEFASRWEPGALRTPVIEALRQLASVPAAARTFLYDDYAWFDPRVAAGDRGIIERRACHVPGLFYAEHHPEDRSTFDDRPPGGTVAVMEQQSRFIPWTRSFGPGWRDPMIAYGATSLVLDDARLATPLYVMSYSHVPCLVHVIL